MIVYAEASGVLAWLLGEPQADSARRILAGAERVVASALTGVECARGLARARALKRISATDELAALRLLDVAEATWNVHDLSDAVLARARAAFPSEPIRTLDALHLATASLFREALGPVIVLSFDDRIRLSGAALDLGVLPERVS